MTFWQWLKQALTRKKKQKEWDAMWDNGNQKADNLSLDPKNDPWRT